MPKLTKFAIPTLHLSPGQTRDEEDLPPRKEEREDLNHDHSYPKNSLPDVNNVQNEITLGGSESNDEIIRSDESNLPATCFCHKKCVDQQSTIDALNERIRVLEKQRLEDIVFWDKIKRVLNEDQIRKMKLPETSTMHWSNQTIMDGIHIYYRVGNTAYNILRKKYHIPLPGISTLCRHLRDVKCDPGVLDDFIFYMKKVVEDMPPHQRICSLSIDEMTLKAMMEYCTTNQEYIGTPTMSRPKPKPVKPGSKKKRKRQPELPLATHAMSFMLCGLTKRWKNIIGYHFTDASFCPVECKDFIFELVRKATEIGLTVKCIVMDNSSQNLAV